MKAYYTKQFIRAIAVGIMFPALVFAQSRSDSELISEVVISTLAKAIGKQSAGQTVVLWAESASERRRLASATGVGEASSAQLKCYERSCREPAEGVRVLIVTSPASIRGVNATVTMEELRGMRTSEGKRWTDVLVHTMNLEKRRGVWIVTSGSTSVPGSRSP